MGRPKKGTNVNPTDADALAKRIINTWRGGPLLTEWIDTLTELDQGTAGTTYVRLRNDTDHAPTIAAFLRTYRGLSTAATHPPPQDHCPSGRCSGDGWITTERTISGHPVRCAEPCTCPLGRSYESGYRRTVAAARPTTEPAEPKELAL